jgi:hypothetical protein
MTKNPHSTITLYCNCQRAKDARFNHWQDALRVPDAVNLRLLSWRASTMALSGAEG